MSVAVVVLWMWLAMQAQTASITQVPYLSDGHHAVVAEASGWVPLDVPAVKEKYLAHHKGDTGDCGLNACFYAQDDYEYRDTCEPKSRILLTAEDGTKHCIQLPPQENH